MSGKYVPPHLRGRGDATGGSAQNSRWSSDPPDHHSPSRPPSAPAGASSSRWGNVTAPSASTGGSRWGNVTDPSLRGPTAVRRPGPPPAQSLDRAAYQRAGPKAAFFGDSFVRLFGLIDEPTIKVRGFKGGSAKGLGREDNENRNVITSAVERMGSNVERLVFVFGSVDVHLSFYYMKYVKGADIDLDDIAESYVDFVAGLPSDPSVIKTVVGVYFSPLEDADVGPSLHSYGSLTEEQAALVSESDDAKLKNRQERVMFFNKILKKQCEERNIEYCDINEEMTDPETLVIKESFKDISNHNIHLVWETTLLLWLDKWEWLRAMAPPDFASGLQSTLEDYLATKPWAEKTHVAQTVGVDGAVRNA